jgi:hypothetical protein
MNSYATARGGVKEPFPHPCCASPLPLGEGPGVRAGRRSDTGVPFGSGTRPVMDVGGSPISGGYASAASDI